MALIRRSTRLLWIRTIHSKLNKKDKSHDTSEINHTPKYDFHNLRMQARRNNRLNSNESAINERNFTHDYRESRNPMVTTSMCYADVKRIIDEASKDSSPRDESSGLRLLESCKNMLPDADLIRRQKLIDQAWSLLENLGKDLTVEHYNILLTIFAQNGQYLNAEEFLRTMKVTPNQDTYRLMLDAVAEIGDYHQASTITARMKSAGYPINIATFNSLILAHSINSNDKGVQAALDTMQDAGIELNASSYCALARGSVAKGDLENLKQTLKKGSLNAKQLMLVVKSLSTFGRAECISEVMKYLPTGTDLKNEDVIFSIVELIYLGKAKDAARVIKCLPVSDTVTDMAAGRADFFFYEIVKADTPVEEILEICDSLESSKSDSSALLGVTEAALRLKKEDIALCAFQAMENNGIEIRSHFYWPLLLNAALSKRETDVIRLIKHMVDNKVPLDNETLCDYTIPFLFSKDPLTIAHQLQDCGLRISQLLTPLLATLLSKGNLEGAIALTDKLKGKINEDVITKHLVHGFIITENSDATAKLLSNISSSSNQNGKFLMDLISNEKVTVTDGKLCSLLSAFAEKKLKISKTAAEVLEPRIARLRESQNMLSTFEVLIETDATDTASYTWIPHPRDMTAEDLECHLADLLTKDMNTRGVLRRLVRAYCGENNLKKAEKFAKMFTDKRFEWTMGMVSGMFHIYVAHNVLDKAEIRYKELMEKHDGHKIDDHKIIDFATLLVNNNKLERALDVLREQKNVKCGPQTVRNCWRLLNAASATGNSENVKRIHSVLIDKKYCKMSNHVLGPLVRSHLVNGDLIAAVAEFKECARIHRKAPLRQELLRRIVKTCTEKPKAQNLLSEVLTVVRSIHGNAAANSQLFMALAAEKQQKELHKLIKMRSIDQTVVNISVQRLTDEKDLTALQVILQSCRGVRKLDNTIIYHSILDLCCRSGDYETALGAWERMQTEDVSPSPQFVRKLTNLLNSERVPVPPELLSSKEREKG